MFTASTVEAAGFPWPASRELVANPRAWRTKLTALLWGVDSVVVVATVAVTVGLRFTSDDRLTGAETLSYWATAPVLALIWLVMLQLTDSRDYRVAGAGLQEYRRVITASLYVFGGLAIVSYFAKVQLSRSLFVTALPVGIVGLVLARWVARKYLNRLRASGRAMTRTLIVGPGPSVAQLLTDLERRPDAGYQSYGVCLLSDLPNEARPKLGELSQHRRDTLADTAVSGRYGAVIVTDGLDRDEVRNLAWRMETSPVELMFQPSLVDVAGPRLTVREVEGLSLTHVDLPTFSGAKLVLKRLFDVAFASVALILLAPVLAVVAIAIKLDDGGPVLFRQPRVGLRGREFTIHKFRTMCVDAEDRIDELLAATGGERLLFKMEDDPRITRLGRILRKYSIDELPQFWSVLRGGMSVVGPRPPLVREVAQYSDAHQRRLLIKPGITGLWQVSGRSDLSLEDSIRLDLRYVENWSLISDVTIVMRTVGVVLRADGAC